MHTDRNFNARYTTSSDPNDLCRRIERGRRRKRSIDRILYDFALWQGVLSSLA